MFFPLLIASTIVKEAEMITVLCTPASAMLILRCMDSDANTFTGVKHLIIVSEVIILIIDYYSWIITHGLWNRMERSPKSSRRRLLLTTSLFMVSGSWWRRVVLSLRSLTLR